MLVRVEYYGFCTVPTLYSLRNFGLYLKSVTIKGSGQLYRMTIVNIGLKQSEAS